MTSITIYRVSALQRRIQTRGRRSDGPVGMEQCLLGGALIVEDGSSVEKQSTFFRITVRMAESKFGNLALQHP